jgi:hypothetical protein
VVHGLAALLLALPLLPIPAASLRPCSAADDAALLQLRCDHDLLLMMLLCYNTMLCNKHN